MNRESRSFPAAGACVRFCAAASLALLAGFLLSPQAARAGTQFGVRLGYADMKGDVFQGSGSPKGTPIIGLQALLPLMPFVHLSLAGESKTRKFDVHPPTGLPQSLSARAEWQDLGLYAALHVRVLPLGVGPFGLYVGGGGGVHYAKTALKNVVVTGTPRPLPEGTRLATSSIDDFIRSAEKKRSDFSWHLLTGASFGLPPVPLSLFGEVRFEDVSGDFSPRSYAAYAGINLGL